MFIIFGVSTIMIVVCGVVLFALVTLFYNKMAQVALAISGAIPIAIDITLIVVVAGAVYYGVQKRSIKSSLAFLFSWSQCMLVALYTVQAMLVTVAAAGNIFMLLFALLGMFLACVPAIIDILMTFNFWFTTENENGALISGLVVWGLLIAGVFLT